MVPTITKCLLSARELRALHFPPDKLLQNKKKGLNKGLKKWTSKLLHFHRDPLSLQRKIYPRVLHSKRYLKNTLLFLVTTLNL